MKRAITVRLEEELIERFKKLSEETYISQTKLVELAIKKLLEEKEGRVK